MDPTSFAFWLNGVFELSTPEADPRKVGFTPEQATIIHDHLQLVLVKKTPDRITLFPSGSQLVC